MIKCRGYLRRQLINELRLMTTNANSKKKSSADNRQNLLEKALHPWEPSSADELARKLSEDVVYYSPNEVLVVNKPYGVSCLGYRQADGGVFKQSRYDKRNNTDIDDCSRRDDSVTLDDALPYLKRKFNESNLQFCMGLKRYISGPVVLPCNKNAFKKMTKSVFHANSSRYKEEFVYRALVICLEKPDSNSGKIDGYATFQECRNATEYVFVPNKTLKRRQVSGKFGVVGEMRYSVLASGSGCSLIDVHFTKFNRHLPRLILSYLGSPVLGDRIYEQRLALVDGNAISVEPKDRWRTSSEEYIPRQLLHTLQLPDYNELRSRLPMYFAVYESSFPLFGKTKRDKTSLVARVKTPEYFNAMARLLKFDKSVENLFDALENEESVAEPVALTGRDIAF